MMTRWHACLAPGVFVVALVNCQGGGQPAEAPSPTATAGHRVVISEYKFNPQTLVVPVGTTVTWVNHDVVPHTVTSTVATEPFDSRKLSHQGTFAHTFTTAGRFQFLCVPHPGMQGAIVVQ